MAVATVVVVVGIVIARRSAPPLGAVLAFRCGGFFLGGACAARASALATLEVCVPPAAAASSPRRRGVVRPCPAPVPRGGGRLPRRPSVPAAAAAGCRVPSRFCPFGVAVCRPRRWRGPRPSAAGRSAPSSLRSRRLALVPPARRPSPCCLPWAFGPAPFGCFPSLGGAFPLPLGRLAGAGRGALRPFLVCSRPRAFGSPAAGAGGEGSAPWAR